MDNEVGILINIADDLLLDTHNCFASNASSTTRTFSSNSFIRNKANSLIAVTSSIIHSVNDVFHENMCDEVCLKSTDSTVSIDMEFIYNNAYSNDINFAAFNHSSPLTKSTICIDGLDNIEISKYLSFADANTDNNTLVIFTDCIPFHLSFPTILSSDLSYDQVYLNDVPGGSVLELFICNDTTTTCSIICNNSVSCFSSTFFVNAVTSDIECSSLFACAFCVINTSHIINDNTSLNIVCEGQASCFSTEIYVDNVETFALDCVQTEACSGVTLHIKNAINSAIICHQFGACDSMTIITDSDNTTLTIYEFSSDILFDVPSGYTGNNLICDPNNSYIVLDPEFTTISDSVSEIYPNLPCSEINFLCNKTDSCSINYMDESADIDIYWKPFFDCYGPITLEEIYEINCEGTCPQSPTVSPTAAPSFAPTETTGSPTNAPSISPSVPPTNAPSVSPSVAPSESPSQNPTSSPTDSPTQTPSTAPTFNPTLNPSMSPSDSPTLSPSNEPSFSPTFSPSVSPTQNPVSSYDFDSYILISYNLGNLTQDDKLDIVNNPFNVTSNIENIINNEYFLDNVITYEKYLVEILDIQGTSIDEIDTNTAIAWANLKTLLLNTTIECNEDDLNVNYCESIKQQSQPSNSFVTQVEKALQDYFENAVLTFTVYEPEALEITCKDCTTYETTPDYILYALFVFLSFLVFLSIAAFFFNKRLIPRLPGFNYVDDGRWAALLIFALQFWDFYSDINLSVEIMIRDDLFDNLMILGAGLGSVGFILVPYIANLVIAANIKTIIRDNAAAKGWFQYHTPIFTVLVVVSGGAYAALSLVSSGIFGLKIFNCGLTQYELKRLGRLKVLGTVVLENIPQLICQTLYASAVEINSAIAMAFVASILSVIASTLSYFIEQDTADTRVVQYYVTTQKKNAQFDIDVDDLEDIVERNITTKHHATSKSPRLKQTNDDLAEPMSVSDDMAMGVSETILLSVEERQQLIDNRGRTLALGESLAEVFGIPPKNIEIGYSMLTQSGVITHVVHYVYDDDLEAMQDELHENGIGHIIVTPQYFASQLFESLTHDITQVFCKHFTLGKVFEVTYHHRLAIRGSTHLAKRKSKSYSDDNPDGIEGKRGSILKRMVTQIGLGNMSVSPNDAKSQAMNALQNWFMQEGTINVEDRVNLCSDLVRGISDGSPYNQALVETDRGDIARPEATSEAKISVEMEPLKDGLSMESSRL